MIFQELSRKHDRASFHCGVAELDDYFRFYVSQDVRNRLTSCWVMLSDDQSSILGFYTLSPASITREAFPAEIRRGCYYDIPVTRLGRFAIASDYQKQGLGLEMLSDAINRALTQTLASVGIWVDMKTPSLFFFYQKLGFVQLPNPSQCFLLFPRLHQLPD